MIYGKDISKRRGREMKKLLTIMTAVVVAAAMSFTILGDCSHAAGDGMIGMAKAKSIAFKNAKVTKSKVRNLECDFDDDDAEYEIEFTKKKNGAEYDYKIDAYSGKIVKKTIDYRYKATTSKEKVGAKKARKSVAKFSGFKYSTIAKGTCKFEKKKRGSKYEIKFRKGNYKYECEVLARNGKVIEWEYKYIGR